MKHSDELTYIWSLYFPFGKKLERCTTLNDIFQDFLGPGIFKKKSRTFQEVWKCVHITQKASSWVGQTKFKFNSREEN